MCRPFLPISRFCGNPLRAVRAHILHMKVRELNESCKSCPFYRAGCRIYQAVFKLGMYVIPWGMPQTIEGPGCIRKLPDLIRSRGFDNVLIVTDEALHTKLRLLDPFLAEMNRLNLRYTVYDKVQPNPTDVNVREGVEIFRKEGCQAIVAFGGGSPMDCAKGIGACHVKNKSAEKLQGLFKVLHRIPTIFAVPTTAGTGSETTVAAVITDSQTHHKASINDVSIMPKYAILDPELTAGLPGSITATTGMDALCHAVEAYTNHTYNSRLEQKLCRDAVRLIHDNLLAAYADGKNLKARMAMQKAAFYAGRAFTRGCVGNVHALGHTLGGLYGTPHGLAMSVILPHVMRQYGAKAYRRLAELADVCGIGGATQEQKAKAFICWIEQTNAKMNIPAHLDVIRDEDVPQIIRWAKKEANPLYPTPAVWSTADYRRCIASIRGAGKEETT